MIELFRRLFGHRPAHMRGARCCPRCGSEDEGIGSTADDYDAEPQPAPRHLHGLAYDALTDLITVTCWRCGAKWDCLPLHRGSLGYGWWEPKR